MKESRSIASAALLLSGGILLSRILGYAREMLLAYRFGASGQTDAFYAAFQIPDLLNYFLAGGALSIAFIPLYNKVLAKEGEAAANDMASVVLGTLAVVAAGVTALLWVQAPALIAFQFPRFDAATAALTVHLTRIVLPAQVFFISGGIIQAVLLARKNFMAAAIAPLVYNVCIIAGGVFLYPICGVDGFAIGTLVGGIAGPFLVPLLYTRGNIPLRARFAPKNRTFLVYLALAAPLMLGQTLLTLDEWYDRWFGALLSSGTVAHLFYARKLMQVPIAVIGQAVAAAALPTLSKLWAEGRVQEVNATLQRTLSAGLSLAVVVGAAFYALATPLVSLVYEHGKFTTSDTLAVAALVGLFSFAIPGWIAQQISVRAFYARGDTVRPMVLGTVMSLLVIPLYMILSRQGGAVGIALAGAIAMTVNALATLCLGWKLHEAPQARALLIGILRTLAVTVPASFAASGALYIRKEFFAISGVTDKFSALIDLVAGGTAFVIVALPGIIFFADEELRSYSLRIIKKLRRA
jgi:putative peptidoglycan lipid II flippase